MHSSNPRQRFLDIITEIEFVTAELSSIRFDEFQRNGTVRRAIERSYAIISEAAVKLGDEAEDLVPGQL